MIYLFWHKEYRVIVQADSKEEAWKELKKHEEERGDADRDTPVTLTDWTLAMWGDSIETDDNPAY